MRFKDWLQTEINRGLERNIALQTPHLPPYIRKQMAINHIGPKLLPKDEPGSGLLPTTTGMPRLQTYIFGWGPLEQIAHSPMPTF